MRRLLDAPARAHLRLSLSADRGPDRAVVQPGRHADRLDRIFASTGTGRWPPAPRSSQRRAIRSSSRHRRRRSRRCSARCWRSASSAADLGQALDALLFAPMIIPDIVLAIALLSFFTLLEVTLGLYSIMLAHVVFNIAFVCCGGAGAAQDASTGRSSRPRAISAPAHARRSAHHPAVDPAGDRRRRALGLHAVGRRVHHRLFHGRRRAGPRQPCRCRSMR